MDKKLSIMVVDDEMIIRESFLHWFEKYGHVVGTASSGVEALEKLETFPFDLHFALYETGFCSLWHQAAE